MFHAGSPAYTDRRMEEFLILLPRYRELLADPKSHVSRQVLFDEYRTTHPDGYGKSQFYYHLKQNLVAKKDVTAVLANTYKPGEKLMVDFAGDKLSYVDAETGEIARWRCLSPACLTATIPMWYVYLRRRRRTFCMP